MISYPSTTTLGASKPIRARYMVSLVLPVMVVTLSIGMCEGVSE